MVRMTDTTDRQVPELPDAENEMSRRYLRMIEQWIPTGVAYFSNWPDRPNCGHFFGGCHWYGIETISCAETFAYASTSPEYDAASTGVSRDALREMAIQGGAVFVLYARFRARRLRASPTGIGPSGKLRHKVGRAGQGLFPREPVRQHGCRVGACVFAVAGLDRRGNVDDGCPRA